MAEKKSPRLEEKYKTEVVKTLTKEFGIKNKLAVPKVEKVVVNSGIGGASKDKGLISGYSDDFAKITGQKPSVQKAKLSVASFGIREGNAVGFRTTLRSAKMYHFLDRLFSIALPRLRDFRGLPVASFDKFGNYSLGMEDNSVFPEVEMDRKAKPFGLEITIVTSTKDTGKAKRLLELMGMPFVKEEKNGK